MSLIVIGFILFSQRARQTQTIVSQASVGALKPITGTFIMYDGMDESEAGLVRYFNHLKELGVDTIIILASGIVSRNPCNANASGSLVETNILDSIYQPIQNTLKAARSTGMKVWISNTSTDAACVSFWQGSATDTNTPKGRVLDFSIRLLNQLKNYVASQGWDWNDENFISGIYISQEVVISDYANNEKITYYRELSQALRTNFPNKKQMVSPWKNESITYDQAKINFRALLANTSVDVIAPQDSMGSHLVTTVGRNADQYRGLKDALSENAAYSSRVAWANVESFTAAPGTSTYDPTNFLQFQSQIISSQPYVQKQVSWILQHAMVTLPEYDVRSSWTNNYTLDKAKKRILLADAYYDYFVTGRKRNFSLSYIPQTQTVDCVSTTFANAVGSTANYLLTYMKTDNTIGRKNGSSVIQQTTVNGVVAGKFSIPIADIPSYASGDSSVLSIRIDETTLPDPSLVITVTQSPTHTITPTKTPTQTPTQTPTYTITPTGGATHTITPTKTPTHSVSPTKTPTQSISPTKTPTPSMTPTGGVSATPTSTSMLTATLTPTNSYTVTPTQYVTATQTYTQGSFSPTTIPTHTLAASSTPLTVFIDLNADIISTTPTISGTAPPGSTITLVIHSGDPITAAVITNTAGNWSYIVETPLSQGEHTVTVTAQTPSGQTYVTTKNFIVGESQHIIAEEETVTSQEMPVSGNIFTTILLNGFAILLVVIGLIII